MVKVKSVEEVQLVNLSRARNIVLNNIVITSSIQCLLISHFSFAKPSQVICYQMQVLTLWTSYQDHTILICLLGELLGRPMSAYLTCILQVHLPFNTTPDIATSSRYSQMESIHYWEVSALAGGMAPRDHTPEHTGNPSNSSGPLPKSGETPH